MIYKAYRKNAISADICERWFRRFKSENFDLEDRVLDDE